MLAGPWSKKHDPCAMPYFPTEISGMVYRIFPTQQEQKSDLAAGKCESKNPAHWKFLLPLHYARTASFFVHCCLSSLHVNIHQEQVAELASLSGTWKYSIVVSHQRSSSTIFLDWCLSGRLCLFRFSTFQNVSVVFAQQSRTAVYSQLWSGTLLFTVLWMEACLNVSFFPLRIHKD